MGIEFRARGKVRKVGDKFTWEAEILKEGVTEVFVGPRKTVDTRAEAEEQLKEFGRDFKKWVIDCAGIKNVQSMTNYGRLKI